MKRILLFVLFLASSCTVKMNLKTGCFEAKNENLMIYNYIELKSDSTYYLYVGGDMYRSSVNGRWKVKGTHLILNSDIQPETKGYFKEFRNDAEAQFEIVLYDFYGKPLNDQTHVFIKQDSNYFSPIKRIDNVYSFDKNKLKNEFEVGCGTEFKWTRVNTKEPNTNKVIVYMVPDTKYLFQTNEHFTIKDSSSFIFKKFIFNKIQCRSLL